MKLYIIAGEPSGDLHGKNLVAEMQKILPEIEWRGVGGDGLQELGVKLVRHIRETNFMGFVQVIKNLGKIKQIFRDVKADIEDFKPDAIILIDYPGFNLRMAKYCRERGIKVLYYISPQIWAWKKNRVKKIKKDVDRMYVILPFEKDFYAKEGVEVDFVGHPLLDEIAGNDYKGEVFRESLLQGKEKLVALLPGSRKQEISRMLPQMLAIEQHYPQVRFVVAGAPSQSESFYRELMDNSEIPVVMDQTYNLLAAADAALVTSGTATLEAALFGLPEVVCYAGSPISVWLARRLIKVRFISLVNLIMDQEIVRELIQQELNPKQLKSELDQLLDPEYSRSMLLKFQELKTKLGNEGASQRTAKLMLEQLS